ncbi:hypothetical protein [Kitasatospora sp. NBC_01302]|uniref:hypothetical protein n=1 Tax=Kitasatospora sp. NBC_01302 TaxID=2903575 RepID=UPI002E11EE02|nr:hypothetical protein OG294_10095 [Kitasatospora sp. NBC_01302]
MLDESSFPLLGIPGWPGRRGLTITGGTGPAPRSAIHSYLAGDTRRSPAAVVFGQSSERDQSEAVRRNLLDPTGRPEYVESLGARALTVQVDGVPVRAVLESWSEPRLRTARFGWRGYLVAVGSWELPLDAAFFASLGSLEPPR